MRCLLFLFIWMFLSCPIYGQYGKITGIPELDLAEELYATGNYKQATVKYHVFLEKNKKLGSLPWIIAKLGVGASLVKNGQGTEALTHFLEVEPFFSDSLPLQVQAFIKFHQAWGYQIEEDFDARLKAYQTGLELAETANDKFRIAQLKLGLSRALYYNGEINTALNFSKQAAQTFRALEINHLLIESLLVSAWSLQSLNDLKSAEFLYNEAITLSIETGNNSLLIICYSDIGEFYKISGQYDKSILYYNKQLKLVENLDSELDIAKIYNDIGAVYSYLGDGSSAIDYYNRSLSARKKAGARPNPITLSNIGLVYHSLNEYNLAKGLYLEALSIFEETKNQYWIPRTLEYLADLHLDWNQLDKALTYAEQAVQKALLFENYSLRASSLLILARIHTRLENHEQALPFYRMSKENTNEVRGFNRTRSLINLAIAFQNIRSDSAFYYADLAFDEIEWLRGNIYGDHLQTEVFRYYASFFFRVASWHIENENDVDKAFGVVEMGKSRSLLDQISASESLEAFVDEVTSLKIRQSGKKIDRLYRDLETAKDPITKKELEAAIADARLGYEVILNEARINNPDFKKLETGTLTTLANLQDRLDSKTALLEFATFDNKLLTIIATHNNAKAIVQEISGARSSRKYLSSSVGEFRASIQNSSPYDSIRINSEQLFGLLVKPLSESFPGIKNIVIVPDVSLGYLPFEALVTPSGEYLIEIYNVKYLPSASLTEYIPNPHRNTTKDLFAVAGSGFESGGEFNPSRSQADFASLPSTLIEVDSISSKFTTYTLLKNEDVSEAGIKNIDLGTYRYLHFATHGTINEDNPAQSGLVLSKKNSLEGLFGEDGLLNSSEIGLLDLNADMVVLSACNTGYGRNVVGEGLLGLQRSFLKAGASSVVVSLWSVFDRSTATFMSEFYENLTSYEKDEFGMWNSTLRFFGLYSPPVFDYKSVALRDAKLSMIRHPYYNHPIHWAPFIYVGK